MPDLLNSTPLPIEKKSSGFKFILIVVIGVIFLGAAGTYIFLRKRIDLDVENKVVDIKEKTQKNKVTNEQEDAVLTDSFSEPIVPEEPPVAPELPGDVGETQLFEPADPTAEPIVPEEPPVAPPLPPNS